MNVEKWNCVFNNKEKTYFASISTSKVFVSDGMKTVFEYYRNAINGCTYNGKLLWISVEDSNKLVQIDSQKNERVLSISSYDSVRIIKMATGQTDIFVVEGLQGDETILFLFDGNEEHVICKLPIKTEYIDFVFCGDRKGFLLCEDTTIIPPRYNDEVHDEEVLFFAEVTWNNKDIPASVIRAITLYIDNNTDWVERPSYGENLRFPLFDQYLWDWLEQKSFSSSGKYVVYYSEDIQGIIIGNPVGGEIYRVISIPTDVADCNCDIIYNDYSEELFVVTKSNDIKKYIIGCNSADLIIKLNAIYNEAFNNKTPLSPRNNNGDMTFTNILYQAIGSCICEPASAISAHSVDGNSAKIIIISGPSASGKDAVVRKLLSKYDNFESAIYATSRPRRMYETPDKDHFFLTNDEFEQGIREDLFLEYTKVYDHYYGIPKEAVYQIISQDKIAICEVDFESASQIKQQFPNALFVYVMPYSLEYTVERLRSRQLSDEGIRERLESYVNELYSALRGDILLINRDLDETVKTLVTMINNPGAAKTQYDKNVEAVVSLKKKMMEYLEPTGKDDQTISKDRVFEMFEEIKGILSSQQVDIGKIIATGEDTNRKVSSLVQFVECDLQTWIANHRPAVDDEVLIEQFAQKTSDYINKSIKSSDQMVIEEKKYLQSIFGEIWNKLLPVTQDSLISAGVLWKLCANISSEEFDYSGIIISATSALESELKKVFFTDFQKYLVMKYGKLESMSAEKLFELWPERLLSKTKEEYENEKTRGSATLPTLADQFTMGMLPFMFFDKKSSQRDLLQKRMREYLRKILLEKFCEKPLKAFNDYYDKNSFVKQCENIREKYRNPAGHASVLSRENAKECYEVVVGVKKIEAFEFTNEIKGLIMKLYSYLK